MTLPKTGGTGAIVALATEAQRHRNQAVDSLQASNDLEALEHVRYAALLAAAAEWLDGHSEVCYEVFDRLFDGLTGHTDDL